MRITRRHLLALSAATAAVGAIGSGGIALRWWDQPAQAPLHTLSGEEAAIVRAIAGTAYPSTETIPLDGSTAGLDRFFDSLLSHMPAQTARMLKLLLHGLDGGCVLSHGGRFSRLSPSVQQDALTSWLGHDLSEIRNASQSLILLLGMGWTIHPEVEPTMQRLHSCGYGA
jgi:hypothetical protein